VKHPTSPTPKGVSEAVPPRYRWEAESYRDDFESLPAASKTFEQLLEARRTRYPTAALSIGTVVSIVREICRYRQIGTNCMDGRGKTSTISAGALQAISVLILREHAAPLVYDRWEDKVLLVKSVNAKGLDKEIAGIKLAAGTDQGDVLLFVADANVVETFYCDPETLVLRDCGALLQNLSLSCSAIDVAFAPLGPLGETAISMIVGPQDRLVAVGTAIIGKAS